MTVITQVVMLVASMTLWNQNNNNDNNNNKNNHIQNMLDTLIQKMEDI